MMRPGARTGLAIVVVTLSGLLAFHHLSHLVATQKPAIWHDSHTFLETAAQPLDVDHLFYPKPFVAPAFDRVVGEPAAIDSAQHLLSLAAWFGLAVTLFVVLRRWRARIAALVACGAFVLAPVRVGFGSAVASESLDDTLRVLVVVLAVALTAVASRTFKHRTLSCAALATLLVLTTTAWIFTRDTNAIVALVALAFVLARVGRQTLVGSWWKQRWPIASAATVTLAAIISIWSSQVIPRQPLGLSLTEGWAPESTKRGAFALVDDFMIRVMPDPAARQRALADGLPWSPSEDHYVGTGAYGDFLSEPQYAATRDWIYDHGTRVYLGWLARHPLARLEEVVANTWNVLTPPDMGRDYMPTGWRANSYGGAIMQTFRSLTESPLVVLLLIVSLPLTWRRARQHALSPIVAVMAWSALFGVFAAYYGDAMEMVRHAWGASQQLILALALAAITALDAATKATAKSERTAPDSGSPSDTQT